MNTQEVETTFREVIGLHAQFTMSHIAAMFPNVSAQASPPPHPPSKDSNPASQPHIGRDCLALAGNDEATMLLGDSHLRPKRRKENGDDNGREQPSCLPTSATWLKQGNSSNFSTITSGKRSSIEATRVGHRRIPIESTNEQICTGKLDEEVVNSPGNLATSQKDVEISQGSSNPSKRLCVKEWGKRPLSSVDPQLFEILEKEKTRQCKGIELIASENFTSQAVMEVLGSHLTNKYSEGFPGARYYGGNEYIDQIESLCQDRALVAFNLNAEAWGVNVQPYSCTSANFAVYTALLQPNDRIMGLDSPSGGHLSHGYYTSSGKKVSAASIFFENLPYKVNPDTGFIDYEKLEEKALDFRPKILICGGSAYPREWDYARFRQIADKIGAILMCDMAHVSGLVAAQECASPFNYCDIVTSTTHKSLRGPRGGMIFYRKGPKQKKRNITDDSDHYDFEDRINFAVFPSLQGGPHNNQIAALAVALKHVSTPEFKAYMQQVKKNAQALVKALQRRGCKMVTEGTDNHLFLWDLRPHGVTGYRFEKVCELCRITLNRNAVYGDSGTFAPGGVRIGTLAMTSRGCVERDFETIADFLLRALQIAVSLQRENGKQQKEFLRSLQSSKDVIDLKTKVENFASALEMPGFDIQATK